MCVLLFRFSEDNFSPRIQDKFAEEKGSMTGPELYAGYLMAIIAANSVKELPAGMIKPTAKAKRELDPSEGKSYVKGMKV